MNSMQNRSLFRALRTRVATACAFAAFAAAPAWAHDVTAGSLLISHPHARPSVPGQPTGAAYVAITNRGAAADRLVGASAASIADHVELHEMRRDGDVMRMREVEAIELPPGRTVTLEPGGLHLMLVGLKAPLAVGQRFELTLTFRRAGRVQVDAFVDPVAEMPMQHSSHASAPR